MSKLRFRLFFGMHLATILFKSSIMKTIKQHILSGLVLLIVLACVPQANAQESGTSEENTSIFDKIKKNKQEREKAKEAEEKETIFDKIKRKGKPKVDKEEEEESEQGSNKPRTDVNHEGHTHSGDVDHDHKAKGDSERRGKGKYRKGKKHKKGKKMKRGRKRGHDADMPGRRLGHKKAKGKGHDHDHQGHHNHDDDHDQ